MREAEVRVEVSPKPEITEMTQHGLKDVEMTVEGGTEPYLYRIGEDGEWQTDNILTVKKYIQYTFYVKDEAGCEASRKFRPESPSLTIDPYFTPNGDGENDTWDVVNLTEAYPEATVTIYDRNGKVLSRKKASEGEWDGTYQGKPMPSTDYWYEINIEELDAVYVGHFTLLR